MKTLDAIFAEIDRRNLFVSSLSERLSPTLQWEAICFLKRRDWTTSHFGIGPTIVDAMQAALAKFGVERKAAVPAADEFEDLLG